MTSNNSLISIIIPMYNSERFIAETIESVINQTYKNWELIIINDGSVDKSESIANKFSTIDKRIQIYTTVNKGVSNARNTGVKLAKGEFVALLDADDTMIAINLETKLNFLVDNSNIDYCYSNVNLIDEKSNFIKRKNQGTDVDILNKLLEWAVDVTHEICSNILVKKNVFDFIQFDTSLSTAADQDFNIQLAKKYKGKIVPDYLVNYRKVNESMSKNILVMEHDTLMIFNKAKNQMLFKNTLHQKKCFANMYLILAGSWYKNGNNKLRGIHFMLKALANNPFIINKVLIKKM